MRVSLFRQHHVLVCESSNFSLALEAATAFLSSLVLLSLVLLSLVIISRDLDIETKEWNKHIILIT